MRNFKCAPPLLVMIMFGVRSLYGAVISRFVPHLKPKMVRAADFRFETILTRQTKWARPRR